MLSRKLILKSLALLVAAQVGCLALALWMHICLVASAVSRAVEEEAAAVLGADADQILTAASGLELPAQGAAPGGVESVRGLFQDQLPDGVEWLWADRQWRILDVPGAAESGSPTREATGEILAWAVPPRPVDGNAHRLVGTVTLGDGEHVVVAARLKGDRGYVAAHRPLKSFRVAPAALTGPLPTTAGLAWAWTSPVLLVVVYLMVARFFDRLSKEHKQVHMATLRRVQSLMRTRDAVILGLASLAESRDEITGRHVERVSYYSSRLAAAASRNPKFREIVTPEFVREIAVSSMLHDIGKVGVEDWILFKPGRFTEAERARMERHSTLGDNYLKGIEQILGGTSLIRMARQIARHHHERWDGTGYPDGLAGTEIPLAARIVAIADVYEALTSLRDYKAPYPHDRCVEIIRSESAKQFDPDLVEAFLSIHQSFEQFAYQYSEHASRGADQKTEESESSDGLVCVGLVAAMKVLDQNWTVPSPLECQR